MSVDLHTHSTMSDGTLSPAELIQLAWRKGLRAIALTDHDTADGVREAVTEGDRLGIEVIPGIELSVSYHGENVHLLGYFFDRENDALCLELQKIQDGRKKRNINIIKQLDSEGIGISMDQVRQISQCGQIGRPHIAKFLVNTGVVGSMDEAFETFLGIRGCAYVPRYMPEFSDAVQLLKKSGGLAVVAHPYNIVKTYRDKFQGEVQLFSGMKESGLDGIEVYYPSHNRQFRKQLKTVAEKLSLLVTGGSDYHGSIRPGTTLAGGRNVTVPYSVVEEMKRRLNI